MFPNSLEKQKSAVRIAKLFGDAEKGGPWFSNTRATVGKPPRLDVHEILKRKPNRLAVPTSDSHRSHESSLQPRDSSGCSKMAGVPD